MHFGSRQTASLRPLRPASTVISKVRSRIGRPTTIIWASLRDRAGDIEGLTEMIGSFADGSSDSVNAVAAWLRPAMKNWPRWSKAGISCARNRIKPPRTSADFRTGFSETMDAISGDLEATIDDMDLGTEAAEAGRATIQGFIDGATGMLPTVQSAYSQLGYAALAALSRNMQNNNSVLRAVA